MPPGGPVIKESDLRHNGSDHCDRECNARPIASTGLSVQALIDTADRFAKRQ